MVIVSGWILLQRSRNFSVADWPLVARPPIFRFALQWSRNFSVADCINPALITIFGIISFNGAATFQLRIVPVLPVIGRTHVWLQWSRNFSVADCRGYNGLDHRQISASMEPQLFSCGLKNSGMISLLIGSLLQWSRNFSVADWSIQGKNPMPTIWGFNGAATFQLRIAVSRVFIHYASVLASMEPQLFSCGLKTKMTVKFWKSACFNGAATFLLRIVRANRCRQYWFVIASMEPQLFSCGLRYPKASERLSHLVLQWSRNFSVADCIKKAKSMVLTLEASMEPQLFSCGLQVRVVACLLVQHCFNGAATFQLRIAPRHHYHHGTTITLQWSRNFSVADWNEFVAAAKSNNLASMEPQLFSCGLQ